MFLNRSQILKMFVTEQLILEYEHSFKSNFLFSQDANK